MISKQTLSTLEFDKVLETISKLTFSQLAKDRILSATLEGSLEYVKNLHKETSEAYKIMFEHAKTLSFSIDDISLQLSDVEKGIILSMSDLLKIARVLSVSRNLVIGLDKINDSEITLLKEYTKAIAINEFLENKIKNSIKSESEMFDSASKDLSLIRANIKKTNEKIRKKIDSYISKSSEKDYLQDNIFTIRNGRYVIPIKTEYKSQIKGLVHDVSQSGATCFIEPIELVEYNNELRVLLANEEEEIKRILIAFSQEVCNFSFELRQNLDLIVLFDTIFAKAEYSKSINGVCVKIKDDGYFNIIDGRHPLIDKEKIVAVSVKLEKPKNMLIITGANTGGKTVCLKMIGLLSLMAMYGLYIPANEESEVSIFDNMFCDIGDEQSIEQSLSTFSSHMSKIVKIINHDFKKRGLVLLDELAMGTDPSEGSALAVAITNYLISKNATTVITTHYHQLKEFAISNKNVQVAAMDFNEKTYAPTYKLVMGTAGSSNALNIAKRLGIKDEVINEARNLLSSDFKFMQDAFMSLESTKRDILLEKEKQQKATLEIESKLKEIEKTRLFIQNKKDNLESDLKREAAKKIAQYTKEAREAIEDIKHFLSNPTDEGLFKSREIAKKLDNLSYEQNKKDNNSLYVKKQGEIQIGDSVFVTSLQNIGIIARINMAKKEYDVQIGSIKTTIKFKDCYRIEKQEANTKKSLSKRGERVFEPQAFSNEINIVGKNVVEAVDIIEKYLEDAILHSLSQVTIVHGKGTGKLREGVHKYLRNAKVVKTFRLGKYGEGDTGVTVVDLKC